MHPWQALQIALILFAVNMHKVLQLENHEFLTTLGWLLKLILSQM